MGAAIEKVIVEAANLPFRFSSGGARVNREGKLS